LWLTILDGAHETSRKRLPQRSTLGLLARIRSHGIKLENIARGARFA
jgi:hypothetical protein